MILSRRLIALTALLAGLTIPDCPDGLHAQAKPAPTLRFAVGSVVSSANPHFHSIGANNAFAAMIFDTLVAIDQAGVARPMLAASWAMISPEQWELRLREDVTFHNGDRFTAEDVAAAFRHVAQVQNSPSSFRIHLAAITEVEIAGPFILRLRTKGPAPTLLADLAQLAITGRMNEHASNDAFNTGGAAIGTGPFHLRSFTQGSHAVLGRNATYWGHAPAWQHVEYRFMPNAATRTAALMAGDVDIIDQVATGDAVMLSKSAGLRMVEGESNRVMFLLLDRSRDADPVDITDPDGQKLRRNPLLDLRVRRALSLAIDRDGIVAQTMDGAATATMQMMPTGSYGHVTDRPPPKADAAQARQLLADAGFPNGLRITLHSPSDFYPNIGRVAQAIAQMWTRAGVRTEVAVEPFSSFVSRASRQEFSAFVSFWASPSGEPSVALRSILGTHDPQTGFGSANRSRYANPMLDAVLRDAMQEMDNPRRERILQDATRMAIDDVAFIPVYFQKYLWAMRRNLTYQPRIDGLSIAHRAIPSTE